MVVRRTVFILSGLVSHVQQRNVGNHLIGIHIGARTSATLNHVNRKFLVILACYDVFTRSLDAGILLVGEQPQLVDRLGSRQLGVRQSVDKSRIVFEFETADGEVLHSTQCLDAVECIGGQFTLAQLIVFHAGFTVCCHTSKVYIIYLSFAHVPLSGDRVRTCLRKLNNPYLVIIC